MKWAAINGSPVTPHCLRVPTCSVCKLRRVVGLGVPQGQHCTLKSCRLGGIPCGSECCTASCSFLARLALTFTGFIRFGNNLNCAWRLASTSACVLRESCTIRCYRACTD